MARTKREIDKEIMFKKIMPSSFKPAVQTSPSEEDAPATQTAPIAPCGDQKPLRSTLILEKSVPLGESRPALLTNVMEQLVADKIDAAITKFRCCKCDKCKKDVAAITLNKLKPKYIVSETAALADSMTERQTNAEVTTALVQAILTVKSHPRH